MRSIKVAIVAALKRLIVSAQSAGEAQDPTKAGQKAKPPAAAMASPAPTGPKTYVGSDTCQACHEDTFKTFQKDLHKSLDSERKGGQKVHACEGCHGPASTHVETMSAADIVNPAKLSASRVNESCLTCHRNQPTHFGRIQSGHSRGRVACTSCHRMHESEAGSLVVNKPQEVNLQCTNCHPNVWAALQRPHAH